MSLSQCPLELATRDDQRQAPFTRLAQKPSDFIMRKYIPGGVKLDEPRAMKRDDLIKFFAHIHTREESYGIHEGFRFKSVLSSRKKGQLLDATYNNNVAPAPAPAINRPNTSVNMAPASDYNIQSNSGNFNPAPAINRPNTSVNMAPALDYNIQSNSGNFNPAPAINRPNTSVNMAPASDYNIQSNSGNFNPAPAINRPNTSVNMAPALGFHKTTYPAPAFSSDMPTLTLDRTFDVDPLIELDPSLDPQLQFTSNNELFDQSLNPEFTPSQYRHMDMGWPGNETNSINSLATTSPFNREFMLPAPESEIQSTFTSAPGPSATPAPAGRRKGKTADQLAVEEAKKLMGKRKSRR